MSQMKFECPKCGQHLEAEDMAGQPIVCSSCKHEFTVPGSSTPSSSDPAEKPAADADGSAPQEQATPTPMPAPQPPSDVPSSNSGILLKLGVAVIVVAAFMTLAGKKGGPARKVMGQLPEDSLGAVAIANPGGLLDDTLKSVKDMEDKNMKDQILKGVKDGSKDALGFDVTDKGEVKKAGFDLGAPICISMAGLSDDMEPQAGVISIGLTSKKAALKTIENILEDKGGELDKDGDIYSLDSDVLLTFKGKRLYVGVGDDSDEIEDALEDAVKPKKKLGGDSAFKATMGKVGGGQLMGYAGLAPILKAATKSMRNSSYVDREALAVLEVLEDNVSAIGIASAKKEGAVYLAFADKAPLAKYFKAGGSCGRMLKKINEPIVAVTVSIKDPVGIITEVMEEAMGKDGINNFDEEMKDNLGIDLDEARDLFKKTAGGAAVYMPDTGPGEPLVLAFIKVNDKKKAADLLGDLLKDQANSKEYGKSEIYLMGNRMAAGVIDDYIVFGNAVGQIEDLAKGDTKKWKPRAKGNELLSMDVRVGKAYDDVPEAQKSMLKPVLGDRIKDNDWIFASLASSGNGLLLKSRTSVDGSGMAPAIGAIGVPSFMKARNQAQRNCCINNLRQIDAAKEQWALANNKTDGTAPNIKEVNEYIKGNTTPVCPSGGTYTYNAIGQNPVCSKHGSLNW